MKANAWFVFSIASFMLASGSAFGSTIYADGQDDFIKLTAPSKGFTRFELCSRATRHCKAIGSSKGYSERDLAWESKKEGFRAVATFGEDALLAGSAWGAGYALGYRALLAAGMTVQAAGAAPTAWNLGVLTSTGYKLAFGTGAITEAATVGLTKQFDGMNPMLKLRAKKALKSKATGPDIKVRGSVSKLANRLEHLLLNVSHNQDLAHAPAVFDQRNAKQVSAPIQKADMPIANLKAHPAF